MTSALRSAIDAQYQAFSGKAPADLAACPCCMTPAEVAILVSTPLRNLQADQIRAYARTAISTTGDASDLRYFWPRLAELSVLNELGVDPQIVFSKPRLGCWHAWSAEERGALLALVAAKMNTLAVQPASPTVAWELDTWVCAFGQFVDDITPFLSSLLQDSSANAHNMLFEWFTLNEEQLAAGWLRNPFWNGAPVNARRLIAWFSSQPVVDAIDQALGASMPS